MAANVTTIMNVRISSLIIAFKKRKQNMATPLNAKWKRQATGLIAVEKSVSTSPSSCKCLNCSLDNDTEPGVTKSDLNDSPIWTRTLLAANDYLLLLSSSALEPSGIQLVRV